VPPYTIDRHQPALHESANVNSPCHIPTVVSLLSDEKSLSTLRAIHRLPPSTSPNSLYYGLQTRSITASQQAPSQPLRVSPNSLIYTLQVRPTMAFKVHLHTRLITASKCISKLARSPPQSVYLSSTDRNFQAHLELLSSTTCSESRYTVCRWVAI